ncbi:MAG: ATP-binding cassette domain-containing protein [Polaromonas sp.]|nr:ATP-binding cassette domain-containing protein [Polaromonas sp.]
MALAVGLASLLFEPYVAHVATSWLIFGLLGLSLDLVWGRMGLLSLGQTAFFGVGAYAGSVAAVNWAGLTGNTLMWSLPAGALAGAGMAALIGWIIFYGRLGALQGTVLTYTVTLMLWTASVSFKANIGQAVIGGDNGMSEIPGMVLAFGPDAAELSPRGMFVCVLTIVAAIFLLVRWLMRSPFGVLVDCIRLQPDKTELLGYNARGYQLVFFCMAGGLAGIAGALYGSWANYLSPSIFSAQDALLVPIYVLVGGLGSLAGPFAGALAVGGLSFWLGGGAAGNQATLVMGACLIGLVMFLRGGLLSLWPRGRRSGGTQGGAAPPVDESQHAVRPDPGLLARLRALRPPADGTPSLMTDGILKRFGGVVPVRHISRQFSAGRVHCVIGPNGAGKSSFLRCCTGVHAVDEGTITLCGSDATRWNTSRRACAGVGIKMQAAQVFDDLDVRTNLWVAAYRRARDAALADELAQAMLAMLGLLGQGHRLASALSHGEQQWLDIGMVLCQSPTVMFFDEPAAGMTGADRRALCTLLKQLALTAAVVVVEHDMAFVAELDADVTVLHQGEVFAEGELADLRQDARILDIYLGRRKHA